jgi:hypothetical protein
MRWIRTSFVTAMTAAALIAGLVAGETTAAEVAGVSLEETVQVGEQGQVLLLNGAGIRKKVVVKVYVGALYLQQKMSDPAKILDDSGPKRMVLHFLYKELGAKKLADAWTDGFRRNQSAAELEKLQERLTRFNALFPTVRRGDRIEVDLLPGKGTTVRVNGREAGGVAGEDFSRALLKVWLGPEPADKGLKKGLLGK